MCIQGSGRMETNTEKAHTFSNRLAKNMLANLSTAKWCLESGFTSMELTTKATLTTICLRARELGTLRTKITSKEHIDKLLELKTTL